MPSASPLKTGKPDWGLLLETKVHQLEAAVSKLEEENRCLRGRLEEEEAARRQVEEKLRTVVEVEEKKIKEVKDDWKKEREVEERNSEEKMKKMKDEVEKDLKKEIEVVERNLVKEFKEVVEKLTKKTKENRSEENAGGRGDGDDDDEDGNDDDDDTDATYKCIVFTDSNGKRATQDSIRNHMPPGKREKYEIQMVVAYRLEDAYSRIAKGHVNVENAYVILDNTTNNVRGGKNHAAEPPDLVTARVATLREFILSKSAKAVVVCQLKPMTRVDVRPYSWQIHDYLLSCGKTGYGCRTQIRLRHLKEDGFHVQLKHDSILDKTYACALLGIHVPDPTPISDLVTDELRRKWESQWPRAGGKGGAKP